MKEPSGKDQVRDHLQNMKVHKCIETEEMHPQILKELADEVAKALSILSEKLWPVSEAPSEWKKGNKIPTF